MSERIASGNLEGAMRRGRGGKEKKWTERVQSDIRAFGITGDWKVTALHAEMWVGDGHGGWAEVHGRVEERRGRRAKHRQEKREATRLGKLSSHTEAYNLAKRHPLT